MTIITIILLSIIVFPIIHELASWNIFGKYLTNDEVKDYIEGYKPFKINSLDKRIIQPKLNLGLNMEELLRIVKENSFIATVPFSLTTKYYINSKGRVLRWSKAHYLIEDLFKKTNNTAQMDYQTPIVTDVPKPKPTSTRHNPSYESYESDPLTAITINQLLSNDDVSSTPHQDNVSFGGGGSGGDWDNSSGNDSSFGGTYDSYDSSSSDSSSSDSSSSDSSSSD